MRVLYIPDRDIQGRVRYLIHGIRRRSGNAGVGT